MVDGRRAGLRGAIGWVLLAAAGAGVFLLLRRVGTTLEAPLPTGPTFGEGGGHAAAGHPLLHLLLALVVVVVAARGVGAVFARFGQPSVIGEIVAGILLGPSLLGRVAPAASAFAFPPSVGPLLGVVAQVGVVLFMFLVGLELDTTALKKRPQASIAISHASIVVPFVLGSFLALFLYPRLSSRDVPFTVFASFLGISMSVTAFPVLARILTDLRLQRTELGVVALTSAAVDDVTAWCLLALVVGFADADPSGAWRTVGLTVLFVAVMVVLVRPLLSRLARAYEHKGALSQTGLAVVCIGLLSSALVTEAIGIHALFGAFLFGALLPHDSELAVEVRAKLTDVVIVLLLPAFFALTGLRTHIGLVQGLDGWGLAALVLAVATAGKLGGAFVAARWSGMRPREAAAIGALMNTRGLMELIVLNIGLDLRVLSPTLFTMLVLMAVATTFLTTPLLRWILRGEPAYEALWRPTPGERAQPAGSRMR